jgi:hypothetical protein
MLITKSTFELAGHGPSVDKGDHQAASFFVNRNALAQTKELCLIWLDRSASPFESRHKPSSSVQPFDCLPLVDRKTTLCGSSCGTQQ